MPFPLDERLQQDTHRLGSLDTSELLMMNDSRWLWLILVPRIEDAVEWHELYPDERQDIDRDIANVASVLKGITGCEKVNIASLGNIVRQLHIHVVARNTGDENWPGPVWGHGEKSPYSDEAAEKIKQAIAAELELETS